MATITEVDYDPFAPAAKPSKGAQSEWKTINASYSAAQPKRDAERVRILQDEYVDEANPANQAALGREIKRMGSTAGNAKLTEVDYDPFAQASAKQGASGVSDSPIVGALAGIGSGVGHVAMGAQHYLGKGLDAIGVDKAGQWLVNDAAQGRAKLKGEVAPYKEKSPIATGGGELAGEVFATSPVGGLLGKALMKAAPLLTRFGASAPAVEGVANALATSGMRAGTTPGAMNMLTRVAGGGTTGLVAAGATNPEDATLGAVIGGGLPVVVAGAGGAGRLIGAGYRSLRQSNEVKLANKLAEIIDLPPETLLSALTQQGPSMIPGYRETVPQILQRPEISQLQRTLKTAGTNALGEAEKVQQAQYMGALKRIAPIDLSVQDAAQRAGSAIKAYAVPAREQAGKKVREAFDSVDPFGESALHLPIDDMQSAQAKFLGNGTFGTGQKAQQAIDTARRVGTETVDAVKPMSAKKTQDLVLAVRAAGGINTSSKAGRQLSGEIRNLRESGLNNIVRPNAGKSVERMAEQMHEAGFLPDNDPATLLDLLHDSAAGNKVFASSPEDAYRHAMEAAQGPPPDAGTFSKTVPFETLQNLRSSIGEAAEQARTKGANKEAAALDSMRGSIDSRVNRAAGGSVGEGEFFPQDMGDRYRAALKLHADKKTKFDTGPQIGMFRKGGDGQAAIQGAEIPGKFFSGRRSQVEDVQALKRLIGDKPALMDEMKRYAVTEGAATANQGGDLTTKFTEWLLARSGANKELFSDGELATLKEVGKAVKKSFNAENMGRVSGSDTAQKLASLNDLGVLDSKYLSILANRIPIVGSVTGPMLSSLRETATKGRNNALAQLLANPDQFANALTAGLPREQSMLAKLLESPEAMQALKAAPVVGSSLTSR